MLWKMQASKGDRFLASMNHVGLLSFLKKVKLMRRSRPELKHSLVFLRIDFPHITWKHSMSRLLSFFLLGVLIFVGLSFVLSLFGATPRGYYTVYLYTITGLVIWLPIWSWVGSGSKETGPLLIKIGRPPSHDLFLFFGLFLAIASLASSVFLIYEHFGGSPNFVVTSEHWSPLILSWNLAICYILIGRSNVFVYENGMYFMFNLLKWQEIVSCRWDTERPNILILNHERFDQFIFGSISKIDIPEERKSFLDGVLSAKLGTPSATHSKSDNQD